MPCLQHLFSPVPNCPICQAFGGGFLRGIYDYPSRIAQGVKGMNTDEARQADRNIRVMSKLAARPRGPTEEEESQLQELYKQVPPEVKDKVQLGAADAFGGFASGLIVSRVIAFYSGCAVSNFLGARLGPQHRIFSRTPATLFVGGLLTYFSFVSANLNFVNSVNQTLQQYPEAKPPFDEAMKKFEDKG